MNAADEARVREIVREELQARDRRDRQLWEAFKAESVRVPALLMDNESTIEAKAKADREQREQEKLRAYCDEVDRNRSIQAPAAWRRLWQRVRGWVRSVTGWWQR